MFKNKRRTPKRVPLARYWTMRYLAALIVGLLIVAFISVTWLKHNTLMNRVDMLEVMADEMASSISFSLTNPHEAPGIFRERTPLSNLGINPKIYIVDEKGSILSSNEPKNMPRQNDDMKPMLPNSPVALYTDHIPKKLMTSKEDIIQFVVSDGGEEYYAVRKTITDSDEKIVGYVIVMESKKILAHVDQEYTQLAIIILSLACIGTLAIYLLSRRLSKPIKDVAKAAQQIKDGNYDVALSMDVKEQEVYELLDSFHEMASRLKQLEATRTELLAGVTHELKTPVTAISGLLQAVKDDVVSGDEEKAFVKMALSETTKLKTMVGDLLAFNSFAVNAIPVNIQAYDINHYVKESIMLWSMSQQDDNVQVETELLQTTQLLPLDGVRFQQILTNLLTNAKQAMDGAGRINVTLIDDPQFIRMRVTDEGKGIPEAEQPFIFERFYRGENKKYAVRGLGLGLALSKMMAQSLKGDLKLVKSNETGTTFEVSLAKQLEEN
ncbi:sensor histidine kinase [Kurthia massiliensis]|uniref:sensor histidine kinase n=1 Tax=Kurthia massiliensis TaxID=1033739 RepID=UPI000288CB4A|nr:HAMP domain-containing sensor histidine kinase [Kurthia massiliensis]